MQPRAVCCSATRSIQHARLLRCKNATTRPIYLKMRYCPLVRLISYRALREFADIHPQTLGPLQGWRRVIETNRFDNWSGLKKVFNAVDKVGDLAVFNIGGNKYRLVAYLNFERQIIYVKAVMTHAEYDKGDWKS